MNEMRNVMAVVKALGEENRARILVALQGRELCVCQIVALLELAPSTVSKHMSILHQARLVDSRKDGRWAYYRLAEGDMPAAAEQATALVIDLLSKDVRVREDEKRLKQILKTDPEELCKRQGGCK